MANSDNWGAIVQLHQYTKELLLLAEEFDIEWKTFLQPVLEQRSALDHICRAMSVEIDTSQNTGNDKAKNLDKAKGHLYRAFFDTADWISTALREKIIDALKFYDSECITAAIPEYYSKVRSRIETINQEIAIIRNTKSIASEDILPEVKKYKETIYELLGYYKDIIAKKSSLDDYHKKHRRSKTMEIITNILIGIFLVICGIAIERYFDFSQTIRHKTSPVSLVLQPTEPNKTFVEHPQPEETVSK